MFAIMLSYAELLRWSERVLIICSLRASPAFKCGCETSSTLSSYICFSPFAILIFRLFLEKFLMSPKNPPSFFDVLQQNGCWKISKGSPFTVFGLVSFFKINNFRLKLSFLKPSTLYPFFFWEFFLICFHRSPPSSIFTRSETFREHKGLLRVFETMWLTEDLHQKKFSKKFFLNFFWKVFGWEYGFFAVFSWEKMVFESYAYRFGYFWCRKIDECSTILSFYPWFSVSYCLFGFISRGSQVFAKHGFASVLIVR